ncbi:MAG: hypothetical protein ACSHW4_16685, partial [Cellulophaga sp.]
PTEGVTIEGNTVQFTWESLDGADDYEIQIINSNQVYEVDSLVTTNTFEYVLNSDAYQWRVRAENFAYSTAYTFPVNFSVETSDDLSNQTTVLSTPTIDFYTNDTSLVFTWEKITTATSYTFQLIKNLNGEETVLQEPDIVSSSFTPETIVFDEDAEYIWKVKAINETSETVYSQRSIFIDTVLPNQPALTSPDDQATEEATVTFSWTNGEDSGNVTSTITNTIEIASDSKFNSIIHSASTVNNSYQYVFSTVDTYYWRVVAIDAATNESDYSIIRTVIIE